MFQRFLQWLFPMDVDVDGEEPTPSREPLAQKLRRRINTEAQRKRRELEDMRWKVLEEHLQWWTAKEIYEKILDNGYGHHTFPLFNVPEDHPIREHSDSIVRGFFHDNRNYCFRHDIIKYLTKHAVTKPFWDLKKEGFRVSFYQHGNARGDCAIEVSW